MKTNDSLGYMLCRTARKIHQQLTQKFQAYDITLEQWVALKTVEENNGLSQKQLALLLEKDQNNVTAMLGRLEKKQLLRREVNQADKRAFSLFVTGQGLQTIKKLASIDEAAIAAIEAPLQPEEVEHFKKQLRRIEAKLAEE